MSTLRRWLSLPNAEPAENYGFFGPDSVTWRVWSYPTSLSIGFQRAAAIAELDPGLVAAFDNTNAIYERPRTRYGRTLRYFAMVAFDDSRSTAEAADVLVKIHSNAVGIDPVTRNRYDANDPSAQLWIHLTTWHSLLYAYEKFGPGRLTADEEARYWADCARAAELQTFDPADVPRTRQGVREYFEEVRPRLIHSDIARRAIRHMLHAEVILPSSLPLLLRPASLVVTAFLGRGALATMPWWIRKMGGVGRLGTSRLLDALIVPPLSAAFTVLSMTTRLQLILLRLISPDTLPIGTRVLRRIPPADPVTTTPREAQSRYGYDVPAQAHRDLREAQAKRVFGEGRTPGEAGLVESERILGRI